MPSLAELQYPQNLSKPSESPFDLQLPIRCMIFQRNSFLLYAKDVLQELRKLFPQEADLHILSIW